MSTWDFGVDEFKRARGELFHQKGRKVWLVPNKGTLTVNPRKEKPFGVVVEDSVSPATTVKVKIWDHRAYVGLGTWEAKQKRLAEIKEIARRCRCRKPSH